MPLHLKARKPECERDECESLGARLRRRRRELDLTQSEVAERLGANLWSVLKWEQKGRLPSVEFYPAIIQFLGYEPWPEPSTLAEAHAAERRRRGLSISAVAAEIGVYEGTWTRWERGEWKLTHRTAEAVERFLGVPIKTRFPADVR
ncbi:helix-turn-helix domain-containing protein [Phenylobacterium sp.]|uniref:helix-turn-helix domain-containing protein n=1 Tax=Phenylobacterium sp. TaxID=1871053 RepID=UPI0039C9DA49